MRDRSGTPSPLVGLPVPIALRFLHRLTSTMRYLVLLLLVLGVGCTSSAPATSTTDADTITVEGTITLRGNEPFTAYMLETEDRNSYVLNLEDLPEEEQSMTTPLTARVTGTLYADAWGDRTYAHLRVASLETITDAEFRQ